MIQETHSPFNPLQSSWFSCNSEAFASELLENHDEMYLRYYIHIMFNSPTTQNCVNRRGRVKDVFSFRVLMNKEILQKASSES